MFATNLQSQKNDFIWLFGYGGSKGDPNFGITELNFKNGNPTINFHPEWDIYLFNTNAVISDKDGNLMLYSNGEKVYNYANTVITGADNLYNFSSGRTGIPLDWSALILDKPGTVDEYIIFIPYDSAFILNPYGSSVNTVGIKYATLSINTQDSIGKLIDTGNFIIRDTVWGTGFSACRHANGRDWWLVFGEIPTANGIYKVLLDPMGVHVLEKQIMPSYFMEGVSQSCFSPDGCQQMNVVVVLEIQHVELGGAVVVHGIQEVLI